ncbi:hybrid sensor histidine kinase/response regulator [Ramlibacter sp.]|uniref:hybrid sensor histidine kinase/response regulator n=1 Tax=Ramlibacter sp. TaxID=1917967 RepID=UPI003D121117
MQRQLTHMVRLIDDLMEISRISTGKIRLEIGRTSLASVLEAALEVSRPAIEAARHRLEVVGADAGIELDADPTRLAQCVGNLLNNAAKYTPPGGHIVLRVARESAGWAAIEVRDNGVGIPKALQEQVFAMFAQVDRTLDRSQGGLGIGLSLVRNLVEMHGGTVTADSEGTGHGSTFTIRLPCHPATQGEPPVPAEAASSGDAGGDRGRRVLVVDDNVDAAETLATMLEMLGHQVRTVHHGAEAVDAARDFRADTVLLDIGLPGLSGYEVARRMRKDGDVAGAQLIAITGWGSDADRERAREAGFDSHLTKPVAIDALIALLASGARATVD